MKLPKLPKLPKFKVSTTEILESGKTPEELGAELIFKALTARDGEEPSDEVLYTYAEQAGIENLKFKMDKDSDLCEQVRYHAKRNARAAKSMKAIRDRRKENRLHVAGNAI